MKFAVVGYFIVLFALLGMFVVGPTFTQGEWMEFFMADTISLRQDNMAVIWVHHPVLHSDMSNYTLEACWRFMGGWGIAQPSENQQVSQDGRMLMRLPKLGRWDDPNEIWNDVYLKVSLWKDLNDKEMEYVKGFGLPLSRFANAATVRKQTVPAIKDGVFKVFVPASIMYGQPASVQIITIEPDGPYRGPIRIEQVYGPPAKFPETVETEGIAKFDLEIQSQVDLRFIAGEREFYVSFTPGMKPLSVTSKQAMLTEESAPKLHIVPFGTMPDVTIDLFDGRAWIGRKQYPARQAKKADLSPDDWFQYHFDADPSILYARVNNTDVGSEDAAQTLAFVVAAEKLTQKEQAAIAVNALAAYGKAHPELPYLHQLLAESSKNAMIVRDYALGQLAMHHHANIQKRIGTDKIDREIYENDKHAAKLQNSWWLMIWLGVGTVLGIVLLLVRRSQNRAIRLARESHGEDFVTPPEKGLAGLALLIVILFIGFMLTLYFRLQLF